METKRYLGIDFGLARVGVAKSDLLGLTAEGIETIKWDGHDIDTVVARLREICQELAVDEIVLGLPQRTDNKESSTEIAVEDFANILQDKLGLPLHFQNEQFTTRMATRYLQEGSSKKRTYRDKVDQVAAEIILQDYLDKTVRL